MTTIGVTCPACAAGVELAPDEVSLTIHPLIVGLSTYAWTCPACQRLVREHANAHAVLLLVGAGVTARTWPKTSVCSDAAPLDEDALIAFGRALEAADDVVAAAQPRVSS